MAKTPISFTLECPLHMGITNVYVESREMAIFSELPIWNGCFIEKLFPIFGALASNGETHTVVILSKAKDQFACRETRQSLKSSRAT